MKYLALLTLATLSLRAQGQYDTAIPSPRQVLRYELGDRYSTHDQIERYLFALRDAAKGRVRIIPYGETYEGRTLSLAVVSSPRNLSQLEQIKSDIHRLADPRSTTEAEADQIALKTPAVAWLSYGVHGDEASSSEAALKVLYDLAARSDTAIQFILQNLVVIIDPLLNPDGHERYVHYETMRAGIHPIEDRNAVEHSEDWPSGRGNHYLFDLNRDWAWLTQRESEARVRVYQEWMPQVHVDFHEMGYNSSYFFFPPRKPINKNYPPSTIAWDDIYGRANAAAFDSRGWNYWSGEAFDLFYPGYGDSWPSLNGAIGMTYEQAGQVGLRIRRSDETILTLKDRIDHHYTASMATLRATAERRVDRLKDFHQFFSRAIEEGSAGPIRAFIVDPGNDPSRAAAMISLLRRQGVEVSISKGEFSLDKLSTYFSGKQTSKRFPAGSYIIPLNQPSKRLIMALMEQEPVLSDTSFYDISTWALPVAYGVETYWTSQAPSVPAAPVAEPSLPEGGIGGGKAAYAYLLRWDANDAIRVIAWLLQHDYRVNVAMKGFSLDGTQYPRGTMIIPVAANPPDLHDRMRELAAQFHIRIASAQSGYTEHGINLGSDRAVRLRKPKIIVVTNQPVGPESFGALWSMFDLRYGIDFTPMKPSQLRRADLHDYTAMIFPDDWSNGRGYAGELDSAAVRKIKTWIADGGTYIGIEGGAAFATATVGKIAGVKLKEEKKSGEKAGKDSTAKSPGEQLTQEQLEQRMTVEEKERKHRLEAIPGTMLRVRLDNTHPLGFGYDTSIVVLKTTQTMFELSERGYNVGIYAKKPRMSGYMSKENEQRIEGTAFLVNEQIGSGNVVLFADDPNFRLFWDGLNKLFLNSVLIMPSIRNVGMAAEDASRDR